MSTGFAFARWVALAYPYMPSEVCKPLFYACARDEWRMMQRQPQPREHTS